jgi:predicted transposase/invertase (TIGR01784 family)
MENNKEKKVKGNAMVNERNKYIRFDWAAKYMLRSKADFAIFEGLITVLVGEKVEIVELLESESNQEHKDDKFNRVDIKAKDSQGRIILVEIQQSRELDYLQRMLYGVAKTITDHMGKGFGYDQVKKVYSINILYFDLGEGADYLYHGQTSLVGVHTKDTLQLTQHEQADLHVVTPEDVFPEYFVIRVNEFDKLAVTPLDEWLQYLKDEYIKPDTTVPGLREARERLEYLKMSLEERHAYDYYLDTLVRDTDVMKTKLLEAEIQGHKKGMAEGLEEGRAKGREEGRAKGREEGEQNKAIAVAQKMKEKGYATEDIAEMTGLSFDEVMKL